MQHTNTTSMYRHQRKQSNQAHPAPLPSNTPIEICTACTFNMHELIADSRSHTLEPSCCGTSAGARKQLHNDHRCKGGHAHCASSTCKKQNWFCHCAAQTASAAIPCSSSRKVNHTKHGCGCTAPMCEASTVQRLQGSQGSKRTATIAVSIPNRRNCLTVLVHNSTWNNGMSLAHAALS